MKLVIRKKQSKEKLLITPTPCFRKFQDAFEKNEKQSMGVVREYYEDLFKVFPPWDKYHIKLIILRIQYRLLKRDFYNAEVDMPEAVKQNYLASKSFNINGLTKSMKSLVTCEIKSHNERESMPKKKVVKKKKTVAKKSKVKFKSKVIKPKAANLTSICLELFKAQPKEQLTNEQLHKIIEKKLGRPIKPALLASYRCYYNNGTITGQTSKPKVKLISFLIEIKGKNKKAIHKILSDKTQKLVLKKKKKK